MVEDDKDTGRPDWGILAVAAFLLLLGGAIAWLGDIFSSIAMLSAGAYLLYYAAIERAERVRGTELSGWRYGGLVFMATALVSSIVAVFRVSR